jgi:hypothetical protein
MAKLGDFKTPTGASGNVLNPMDWLSFIVGAVVLIITFAIGQNFATKIGSKLPIDTQVDQPWKSDIPAATGNLKPSRVVL